MNLKFLNPFFLPLLSSEILIIILYLIKPKRLRLKVPSLLLWERVLKEEPIGRWFKKLPKNLILLLQILTVMFIILFLSKPVLSFEGIAGRPVIFVLDSSASMTAKDISPSRFERAKTEIINLSKKIHNKASLIIAKDKPQLLISSGKNTEIEKVLKDEKPFLGEGNLNYAISYVENLFPKESCDIHIFTDGTEKLDIPKNSQNNYFIHIIGKGGKNLAILDGRVFQKNEEVSQIFLKIGNFSNNSEEIPITVKNEGKNLFRTKIYLQQNEIKTLTFETPILKGKIEASIDMKDDLPEDNIAYFYVPDFSPRILIITMGNPFLEKAVRAIPGAKVEIRRDIVKIDFKNYDFFIFDGLIPYLKIPGKFLFIGAYPGMDPNKIEKVGKVKILSWEDHPILRFVQLYGTQIDNAYVFRDEKLKPIIYSTKGPVGYYLKEENMEGVILSFDLLSTSWIYHDSFPLFIYNLIKYMLSYDPQRQVQENLNFTGFYEDPQDKRVYAINLFSEKESKIEPQIGSQEVVYSKEKPKEKSYISLDLSYLFLFLALITIFFEMLLYMGGRIYT
ncbi:MAG: BatA and WFA domain-containing protein [Dictyoglomus thermophilum]|nr:BatA and WFA domain-containing protein [Dictyoglomus thermophilum]MCX7720824.1 BatA and WFA domain-containing protein [Dictyoglomus thermophilum]